METIEELKGVIVNLKEIIVDTKMNLVKAVIPDGHCPYAYYTLEDDDDDRDCTNCTVCRKNFFEKIRKKIEKEVESL